MGRVPITVMGLRCERCGNEWIPKNLENQPRTCPKCKSPHWDVPRRGGSATTYEEFRDRVRTTLSRSKEPLTWTEVRTQAKLPQLFPNNKWVRRMESELNLVRKRDKNGIIHWWIEKEAPSSDNPPTRPS